jgi:predicted amidophosphoribosyltransferase
VKKNELVLERLVPSTCMEVGMMRCVFCLSDLVPGEEICPVCKEDLGSIA